MPGFLTHWRVLIETAQRSQDAGNDLGSLIIDASALRRRAQGWTTPPLTPPAGAVWNTGPLPEIEFTFPGSDISAMAYLGALAPAIPDFQAEKFRRKIRRGSNSASAPPTQSIDWADLLHTKRSGDVILTFLERTAEIPSPALRSQALAFTMGYLTHVATDIALAPAMNALASTFKQYPLPGRFAAPYYVELCLDEYIASTFFNHPLYTWGNQPWMKYVESAIQALSAPHTFSAQVLQVLQTTVQTIYSLNEVQSAQFLADYQTGLQGLRHFLGGRGSYRLLTFRVMRRKRTDDPVMAEIVRSHTQSEGISFEEIITYAIRLSERLCRRAISYYASLRNTNATAAERRLKQATLREDLRNWSLLTGYAPLVTFDQEVTLRLLHNWVHFAELWTHEEGAEERLRQALSHSRLN